MGCQICEVVTFVSQNVKLCDFPLELAQPRADVRSAFFTSEQIEGSFAAVTWTLCPAVGFNPCENTAQPLSYPKQLAAYAALGHINCRPASPELPDCSNRHTLGASQSTFRIHADDCSYDSCTWSDLSCNQSRSSCLQVFGCGSRTC